MVDDLDDPYIAAQRRAARNKAIGAALVVLVLALGILWYLGQKQAARDAVVADTEAMISDGSYEGLTEASRTVGREASADELGDRTEGEGPRGLGHRDHRCGAADGSEDCGLITERGDEVDDRHVSDRRCSGSSRPCTPA